MYATLLQGSFDKIKVAKNQLTGVSAQGIESVNRPVGLGFLKVRTAPVNIICGKSYAL